MINSKTILAIFCSIIIFSSCKDKKQNTESDATVQEQAIEIDENLEGYSKIFNEIVLTDNGQIRGFNIGDTFDEVIHNEKAAFMETQEENIPENEKHFTHHFDQTDLNFVDIVYTKNENGKLNKIVMDVFLERKTQVDSLMADFKKYYTQKYGEGVTIDKTINWTTKENIGLELKDVSSKMDAGCKLIFSEKKTLQ